MTPRTKPARARPNIKKVKAKPKPKSIKAKKPVKAKKVTKMKKTTKGKKGALMWHTVALNKIPVKYSISISILKSTSAIEATVSYR